MSDKNDRDAPDLGKGDFDDIPEDGGFEDFEGGGATLGDMWRNNPLVKIGVIAGGLITIIGAIILFGGSKQPVLVSRMKAGQDVNQPPGGEVPDSYREAVKEVNTARTEEAIRKQQSAIPTPIDTPVARLNLPEEEGALEDPLERWRRIQEERQRQTSAKKPEPIKTDPYASAIDALAQSMANQMEGVLTARKPLSPKHMEITDIDYLESVAKKKEEAEQAAASNQTTEDQVVNILIPAGKIEYGQLIVEANSDAPGPILAHLVSGPFAGSRLIGTFTKEEEFLVLEFNSIVIDGIGHRMKAVAINPESTSIAMATEVDHRYFSRVILPAAAAFIEGMGGAIADTGSTTSVSTSSTTTSSPELDSKEELFKGVEEAAKKVSEILDENAKDTETLVRVESGTPMGIFFVEPVTDDLQ